MAEMEGGQELKQEHIKAFGKELGEVYHELYNEVVCLFAKWLEYRKLYAVSQENIDVLNETASFFFYIVEAVLRADILLHISRLTDFPKSGKSKRLSLLLLPTLVKDKGLADELQQLVAECRRKCDFARDFRNKQIAHTNYTLTINPEEKVKGLPPVSRQRIGDALASIGQVMNRIEASPTSFDLFHTVSGADALVFYLTEGLRSEKRKTDRFRKGDIRPEDLE